MCDQLHNTSIVTHRVEYMTHNMSHICKCILELFCLIKKNRSKQKKNLNLQTLVMIRQDALAHHLVTMKTIYAIYKLVLY